MYANAFFIGYDLTFIAYPVNFLSFRVTLLSLQCWKKRATADAAVKSCSRSKQITAFGHRKSGKRERIRNTLKKENGLPQPFTHLACRLGRCFCFAEVSTGHPHLRNDGEQGKITVPLRFGGGGLYIPFIYFLKLLPV